MVHDVVKELEAARSKVAELEKSLNKERQKRLAGLPAEFGYDSPQAFIDAFKLAAKVTKPSAKGKKKSAPAAGGARKRAKITDETKSSVKEMVAADKTGAEIAQALGISLPSVQNIK